MSGQASIKFDFYRDMDLNDHASLDEKFMGSFTVPVDPNLPRGEQVHLNPTDM